jgi:hypothetical protein
MRCWNLDAVAIAEVRPTSWDPTFNNESIPEYRIAALSCGNSSGADSGSGGVRAVT